MNDGKGLPWEILYLPALPYVKKRRTARLILNDDGTVPAIRSAASSTSRSHRIASRTRAAWIVSTFSASARSLLSISSSRCLTTAACSAAIGSIRSRLQSFRLAGQGSCLGFGGIS
jgi:hypothetical protein